MKNKKIVIDIGLIVLALAFLLFQLFRKVDGSIVVCFLMVSFITLFYMFLGSIKSFSKTMFLKNKIFSLLTLIFSAFLLYLFVEATIFTPGSMTKTLIFYLYFGYLFILFMYFVTSFIGVYKNEGSFYKNVKLCVLSSVSFVISLMSFLFLI